MTKQLKIIKGEEVTLLNLENDKTLVLVAQPETEYQVLDENGQVIQNVKLVINSSDLEVYLDRDIPHIILEKYTSYYPYSEAAFSSDSTISLTKSQHIISSKVSSNIIKYSFFAIGILGLPSALMASNNRKKSDLPKEKNNNSSDNAVTVEHIDSNKQQSDVENQLKPNAESSQSAAEKAVEQETEQVDVLTGITEELTVANPDAQTENGDKPESETAETVEETPQPAVAEEAEKATEQIDAPTGITEELTAANPDAQTENGDKPESETAETVEETSVEPTPSESVPNPQEPSEESSKPEASEEAEKEAQQRSRRQ
ncbi:hypothetical protein RO21_02155, partial [[Actinobacillus] muris]